MMRASVAGGLVTALVTLISAQPSSAGEFKFSDGDRVVLLGNTLIEREQRYGYWETMLTRCNPDKNITFRNLGWSGDTVWGEARAGFGTAADGFRQLKEQVSALKPTVIIIAYGGNESFGGKAGLPRFVKGLNTLLDTLDKTKARIILLSPLPHALLPAPLPDPSEHNKDIELYRDAIHKVAQKRSLYFVDLFKLVQMRNASPSTAMTDNGIHLTAYGYRWSAADLAQALGLRSEPWKLDLDASGKTNSTRAVKVSYDRTAPLVFRATDEVLPEPRGPGYWEGRTMVSPADRSLLIRGLSSGAYVLKCDGEVVTKENAAEWADGLRLNPPPADINQVEQLRQKIVEKNLLYFHRWRPQNDTYLFGFRKHEQGNNAVEIPQLDPLVVKLEAEIAKLRVPVAHKYELVPERSK